MYRSARRCGDGDWRGDRVIIFTVINYGLTYIGVNPYWQYIIKGIIIFAVALDSLKYARKK
ncbi:hypothetical protein [Escherichia coli]|uniref:hypothetical protein n=1 Tax=Escherichia coli TaxID=562 RepID=UPI002076EB14|nr:hypothetical protein [Escherichia coli]